MKIEISNFKLISVIDDWDISCEISLMLLSVDLIDVKTNIVSDNGWRPQAITRTTVDPDFYRHTWPLGHSVLKRICHTTHVYDKMIFTQKQTSLFFSKPYGLRNRIERCC